MPETRIRQHTIEIVVAVSGRQLSQHEREALERSLKQSINTLLADLQIPAKFNLSMGFSEATAKSAPSVRVSIHGKDCRIPFAVESAGLKDVNREASTIMEIVHRNRALLVDEAIARSIGETPSFDVSTSGKQLPITILHQLLATLVQRCYSVRRWEAYTPEKDTAGWSFLQYYNDILAAVDATSIRVALNPAYHKMKDSNSPETLRKMVALMQEGLFYELGIFFPQVEWSVDESLAGDAFQIQINDVQYPVAFGLKPEECLVNDTAERLLLLNIEGKPAINPANGQECAIIAKANAGVCEMAGLTTWNPLGYLILHLSEQLRQQAGSFLTQDVLAYDLDALSQVFPALVDTVLHRYNLGTLTGILRELLDEALSIRDLRYILENLLLVNGTTQVDLSQHIVLYPEGTYLIPSQQVQMSELGSVDYANYVRARALQRYISHKYARSQNTLVAYLLAPEIEAKLHEAQGQQLPEAERKEIIDAVYIEVGNLPHNASVPVILTNYEIRRHFRKLIEVEFPRLAVLSYQELSPDMNIQPIATISLNH